MTNAVNLASAAGTGFAFRNRIINGDMRVDQRNGGAAVTVATSAWTYVLDRWRCYTQSGAGSANISQVIATDTGGSFAYLRFNQTVATTISSPYISQPIEDIRNFNGTTVTLSFRARVASGTAGIATGFSKNYGSGGSAAEYPSTVSHTLTTSWQTFTYTVALSSNAGKTIGASSYLDVFFALPAQATFDIHITDVQLEVGTVATPFERRPYGLELALCQRYYETNDYDIFNIGSTTNGTIYYQYTSFNVSKRTAPTVTYNSTFVNGFNASSIGTNLSAVNGISWSASASSTTNGSLYILTAWKASAEL